MEASAAREVRGGMPGLQNLDSFMAFMTYHMHRKAWAWVNTCINALSDSTGDIYENPDKNLGLFPYNTVGGFKEVQGF